MPHVFFLLAVILGLFYGVFKGFVFLIDSVVLIDERFVSNVKKTKNSLLNFFILDEEDENIPEEKKSKIKKIDSALRFDFFISSLLAILWFFYPFMLIQLTSDEIVKKSPEDKYIGKWIGLLLLFTNIVTLKFIKEGKTFSKQYILLVKLIAACIIMITMIMISCFTGKLYISNIINIILVSIWLSNSAVGVFISYSKKDI